MADLAAGAIAVWWLHLDRLTAEVRQTFAQLMLPEEHAQHQRFVFEHSRDEYLATRGLCRLMLCAYTGVAPAGLTFARNTHGRPELTGPAPALGWRFNLTNTRQLVACALSRGREVGLDGEWCERRGETVSIADRFFARAELAQLLRTPDADQRRRFFDFWTLKESYIKARGMGLAIPLEQFAFDLGGPEITLRCDPRLGDDGGRWAFAQHAPTADHLLSLCFEKQAAPPQISWQPMPL